MRKTISLGPRKAGILVLVLALCSVTKVANADFFFGEPVNLGPPINSPSRDVAFTLSADGLEMYVSSERSGGLGYIDMWRSTRENADGPWGPLVNVQEINSRYNEVFPSLSADGLTLYLSDWYAWNAAGDRPGGVGGHDLWMCTRASRNVPWGTPVNVGAPLNSGSHEISPAISHDGLTFIFASKRSGGRGDYDLWMSTRPTAESDWAAPVNMGPAVNSSAYDAEPWLSPDGLALLFCSNRSGGMGSYDVWLTTRRSQAAAWNPPVNLGPPINTSGMEGMASLSPDLKTLYFGTGDWEAYEAPIVLILDFNGDGIVDAAEMCTIVDHWGTNYPSCDIGAMPWGDGVVDVEDLKVLAGHLFEDVTDPTLLAHWAFDEMEGDVAYDSAGVNDAFVIGEPRWNPDGGHVAGALEFDGLDDSISTPAVLNPSGGPFSVFAWVQGGMPGQIVVSQFNGANWLGTDTTSGCIMTQLCASGRGGGALQSEIVITDGAWHRVGFVWDGLYRSLYVDDTVVAEDSQTGLRGPSAGLNIGCGSDSAAGTFWLGLIDDIRIYSRAIRP